MKTMGKAKIKRKSEFKVIIITGTPGTGKTSLAKELSLLTQYKHIEGNKVLKKASKTFDLRTGSNLLTEKQTSRALESEISKVKSSKNPQKGVIIDSHMSHFLRNNLVDFCIILKAPSLKALQKRLKLRKYSSHKIRENLDSEIFGICLNEALEHGFSSKSAIFQSNTYPKSLAKKALKTLKKYQVL